MAIALDPSNTSTNPVSVIINSSTGASMTKEFIGEENNRKAHLFVENLTQRCPTLTAYIQSPF